MKRALAILLVLLLVAPGAGALRDPEPYPAAYAGVLAKALARVDEVANGSTSAAWFPDAKLFLDRAHDEAKAGRFRAALFDAETAQEIVRAHQLQESVNATASGAGERKVLLLQRLGEWRADGNASYEAFRARLHGVEAGIRSLQAAETILYAATLALEAKLSSDDYEGLADAFARQPEPSFDYVVVLTRATLTPTLDFAVANDLLDAGLAQDGVPPALLLANWTAMLRSAATPVPPGSLPPSMDRYEALARPLRANNESVMSLAAVVLEQGAQRYGGMQTIFGDAASRGKDAVRDADRSFLKQLNNTTLQPATDYGLQGVFVADAVDRALATQRVVDQGAATLGLVLSAWSGLDRGNYATQYLAVASTVKPAEKKESPAIGLGVGLVALVGVALAVARRK